MNTGNSRPTPAVDPSFWQGRRVLLTGHTGFKGSWLALWLLEMGAEVTGLALEPEVMRSPRKPLFTQLELPQRLGSRHRIGDIRNPEIVREAVVSAQPEVVFHLAAQALVRQSFIDPLGTWSTNVQGSLHVLDALRDLTHPCAAVMVTTDKVYENRNWTRGYLETDRLGGHDPYSASKAAAELAIASWRDSFCGSGIGQTQKLAIATARAGNVIGGGDWARDRLFPDAVSALVMNKPIQIRNPDSTRPWQHVLEPLSGYLLLAQKNYRRLLLAANGGGNEINPFATAFNFGPSADSNRSVKDLITEILKYWPGTWEKVVNVEGPHESILLHLDSGKASRELGWQNHLNFEKTVMMCISWYSEILGGADPYGCCRSELDEYVK